MNRIPLSAAIPVVLLLLSIVVVMAARVRLLPVPLERDEGEYGYIAQLMLEGIPPYSLAANMKLPGTNAAYAVVLALFGQTPTAIHLGLLLANAGAILLVFLIGRRLFHFFGGVVAAAAYALWSVGLNVVGVWAHATHFVMLFALGGMLLLLRWEESRRLLPLIAAGLLCGMAFLMKQPGICFVAFGALYIVYVQRRESRRAIASAAIFSTTAALPFGITCLLLWRAGVFPRFWFWVFEYAREYVGIETLGSAATALMRNGWPIAVDNVGVSLLAAAGFFLLWTEKQLKEQAVFLNGFLFFSALAVCPGFYFRPHYFILVLPAVALLSGALVHAFPKQPAVPLWLMVVSLAVGFWQQQNYLFLLDPVAVVHETYGTEPFAEAVQVANYLKEHTKPGDRILILGSEPEMYFYSHRRSATSSLYMYPLMEKQLYTRRMQLEYMEEAERSNPEYAVFVNCPDCWYDEAGSMSEWMESFVKRYERVGVFEILPDETNTFWGPEAEKHVRTDIDTVTLLRRREGF